MLAENSLFMCSQRVYIIAECLTNLHNASACVHANVMCMWTTYRYIVTHIGTVIFS